MALSLKAALNKDRRTTTAMQHRHFAIIAQIIASLPDGTMSRHEIATIFASRLQLTNGKFDKTRFTVACMPNNPFDLCALIGE